MAARTISKRELAADVGRLWGDLAIRSKRSIRPLLEAQGVTMPQAIVLQTLRSAGGRQPARELGRECHMLASTVTGVIDRLELAGHVRRERDSRDRRIVWVVLTEEGEQLVERIPSFFEQIATRCGLGTAAILRHHFGRVVGTSPQAYRRSFCTIPA